MSVCRIPSRSPGCCHSPKQAEMTGHTKAFNASVRYSERLGRVPAGRRLSHLEQERPRRGTREVPPHAQASAARWATSRSRCALHRSTPQGCAQRPPHRPAAERNRPPHAPYSLAPQGFDLRSRIARQSSELTPTVRCTGGVAWRGDEHLGECPRSRAQARTGLLGTEHDGVGRASGRARV